MNYEEMSDFEINWKVAECLGLRCIHERGGSVCYQMQFGGSCMVDYCNNPSDAWPIIDKHKICIHNDEMEGSSYACSFDKFGYVGKESYCDNTLRAAMVVFLMMQEQDK